MSRFMEVITMQPGVDDEPLAGLVFVLYVFMISTVIVLGAVALSN